MKRLPLSLSQNALIAIIVVLLPILVTFTLYYNNIKKKFSENFLLDLSITTEAYEVSVRQFLESHKRRALDFSSDGFIREYLQRIGQGDAAAAAPLNGHLKKNKMALDEAINAIYILSLDGRVLASTQNSAIRNKHSDKAYFANTTGGINITDNGAERAGVYELAVSAQGDKRLLKIMLENLLGNAWKFTAKKPETRIELGVLQMDGETEYFVRDNGAGFDMKYVEKLFTPFQRLHAMTEFSGTGIGLAIVQRVINRHHGGIRAQGAVEQGATFFFTLKL